MTGEGTFTICGQRLEIEFEHPPIPIRKFDWCVVSEDYDPEAADNIVGRGQTRDEAIKDYFNQTQSI